MSIQRALPFLEAVERLKLVALQAVSCQRHWYSVYTGAPGEMTQVHAPSANKLPEHAGPDTPSEDIIQMFVSGGKFLGSDMRNFVENMGLQSQLLANEIKDDVHLLDLYLALLCNLDRWFEQQIPDIIDVH